MTAKTPEQLVSVYGDMVYRLAYAQTRSRHDADDIFQEVFLQTVRKRPVFDSEEHEKAWLLRVAANLSKNRLRYNARRRTDQLAEELVAEEREDLSFVWEAVRSLPPGYRETLHLFYQEGYSAGEIARLLGQKETTVRTHLARGREKLRAILGEAYDFDEKV